jgi:protein-S-isoprenylcysteine O-methyltransferase Ste14
MVAVPDPEKSPDHRPVTLAEQMSHAGDFLFRWRSYLPLALAPLLAAGVLGAPAPLGAGPGERAWQVACALIAAAGVALRMYTVGTAARGTSGRNTRGQKAASLNTTGPYSVVRHPLYVANYVIALGLSLFPRAWFVPVILSLAAVLYYERIAVREEEFLEARFGPDFRAWAAAVPAFVPALRGFRPAARRFSWKTALVREHYAIFEVTALLFLLEVGLGWTRAGQPSLDPIWTTIFGLGAVLFVTIQILKKRTRVFRTPRGEPPSTIS